MKPIKSLAFIETRGITVITAAIDEMLKTTDIKLVGFKNSGSAYLTAAVSGQIEDITYALEVGLASIQKINNNYSNSAIKKEGLGQLISSYIIPNPVIDFIDLFFIKKPGIYHSPGNALGFIDSRGLVSLIAAADVMSKSQPIEIIGYHKMGSGRLNLTIQGNLEAVAMAIEMGIHTVKQHGNLIGYSVLANPHPGIKGMLFT